MYWKSSLFGNTSNSSYNSDGIEGIVKENTATPFTPFTMQ